MIAAGLADEAARAAEELRDALCAAGVHMYAVRLDPYVWDDQRHGPLRLVELGSVHPAAARQLADLVRKGSRA